eukprot:m.140153 g.140153  ORF g.140153 m.140153 type:complete len:560 (+) comp14820_c0_seq2:34-1713(+)
MVNKMVLVTTVVTLSCILHATLGQKWGPPGQANGQFPPGWNGKARTPPMGWRSWNAFGNRISQQTFIDAIDAMVAKNFSVDGTMVSLLDIGYSSVGIDEGWEGCGMGVNHSQHYINGTPAINSKFPDIKGLVDYGHSKNLTMGFYQNGCACGERTEKLINYEGDVRMLHDYGFDAVKLDGCGRQRNLTLYAELMQQSGKNYSIENCHWGACDSSDDSSCPTLEWCPFNWYRSSGDINAGQMSWFRNLQTTIRFQDWNAPVSRPGCWAYPDMLEVGRVQGPMSWNRAHFGAWCIVSAPLVLGLELTSTNLQPIIDIIANKEALAVNQAWAGHPGTLLRNVKVNGTTLFVAGEACDGSPSQKGWAYDSSSQRITKDGKCVDYSSMTQVVLATCDPSSKAQQFSYDSSTQLFQTADKQCLDIWDFTGPRVDIYGCNSGTNQKFTINGGAISAGGKCLTESSIDPDGSNSVQIWAKPQQMGSMVYVLGVFSLLISTLMAVLVINSLQEQNATVSISLKELNITSSSGNIRDIWNRKDMEPATGSITLNVGALDSAFLLVSPSK